MKNSIIILSTLFFIYQNTEAQSIDYNLSDGFIDKGFDVVSYFNSKPQKGSDKYVTSHRGIKLRFYNAENLRLFQSNPEKYFPQFGGWCAYAMGSYGKKVDVDAETFEIRNGKLYLFYNSWGNNTLKSWLENPNELLKDANKNWEKIKY